MLERAVASVFGGRIATLALLLAVVCALPWPLRSEEPAAPKPLATFSMEPDRLPFVTLSVGGKDYQCVVHTAAVTTVLHETAREALGEPVGQQKGGAVFALPAASIGELQFQPGTPVQCRNLARLSRDAGRPIDGVIGMDLLAKLVMTLDFDQGLVTVTDQAHCPDAHGEKVTIVCQPQPYVVAEVCGEELALAVESAFRAELSLEKNLIDRLGKRGAAKHGLDTVVDGDNGKAWARYGLLSTAGLKGSRHERVLFHEQSGTRSSGIMGLHFLARYNPTICFASNEMLLSRSKWHDGRWWPTFHGLTLVEVDGRLILFSVRSDSPASRAGLQPSDEVDLPLDFRGCGELWRANTPLTLRVRKQGAEHFSSVRLVPDSEPPIASATAFSASDESDDNAGTTRSAAASTPLASFPMGPDRMPRATVSLGGKDYQCILDTGSQITCWNKRLQSELGAPNGQINGRSYLAMPALSLGRLQVPSGEIAVYNDLDGVSRLTGATIDGIIGIDILSRVALSLDFDEGMVKLHPPDYRPAGRSQAVKMYCMPRPYTSVRAVGRDVLALIDTANNHELSLRKDLVDYSCARGDAIILGLGWSASLKGIEHPRSGLLAEAGLMGCRHKGVDFTECSDDRFEGIMGMGLLARYNVTLRFADNELVFSKSKWHDAQWWPGLCGMSIADVYGKRTVFAVRQSSAAFRAGIRPEDEIDLPKDFLRSWSFGFERPLASWGLPPMKLPMRWEMCMPIEPRTPMWANHGPVTLRARKPQEANFVTVQVDEDAPPGTAY